MNANSAVEFLDTTDIFSSPADPGLPTIFIYRVVRDRIGK
jgi:hypothetical protein